MKTRRMFLSALLACTALQAQAVGRLADVRIIDRDSGATLPVHHHRGEYWVAGTPGARYAILVRSRADVRLLAVTSVDGVNVLSGETAAWDQTGYVFSPRGRYQITGWRKSDSVVAAFEFAAAGQSYAGRTGRPDHVGVIGVALFREKLPQAAAPVHEHRLRQDADRASSRQLPGAAPAPASPATSPTDSAAGPPALAGRRESAAGASEQRSAPGDALAKPGAQALAPGLGTGHGRRESSRVTHTRFAREQARPDELVLIRYDSHENLVAGGVIPAPIGRPLMPHANPFPLSEQASYVPDPPPLRH